VVTARIEIGEPSQQSQQQLLDLLVAAARGEIVVIPVPLRRLIQVSGEFAHIVRLPVTMLLRTLRLRSPAPSPAGPPEDAGQEPPADPSD
jgi:hypothetical protein